jgi:beta-lactamase regulating signal transducer with metallopeptidase domain
MSVALDDPVLSALISIAVKVSLVLALAVVAQLLLRTRTSAAARHFAWTMTIAALLVLPALSAALPAWVVSTRAAVGDGVGPIGKDSDQNLSGTQPSIEMLANRPDPVGSAPGGQRPIERTNTSDRATYSPGMYAAGIYFSGVLAMLLVAAVQRRSVQRLVRESTPTVDATWINLFAESAARMGVDRTVRLLRSRERSMPIAVGIRRPAIVLPAVADTWSDARRQAVLLHEMAHIARQDCLTQRMAFAACALYWFHPGTWWVARRLQIERELACDDRVIAAGAPAQDYAGHLLDIAYTFGPHRAPALAVGMARSPELERRLRAVVDTARDRRVPARGLRLALTVVVAALLVPLASATTKVVGAESAHEDAKAMQASPDSFDARVIESALRFMRIVAFTLGVSQDRLPGTWEIRPIDRDGLVHLRMTEVNSTFGHDVPIERFEGLTSAQLAGIGPIQFRLRRDAGTFTFDGVVRSGVAAGTFSFALNPAFPAEMKKRGFAEPNPLEQYQLARHDIGYGFIDELNRQGYAKPATADLVRAGQHGVGSTYLTEMGALGYRVGALDPLIILRDHGVTPIYIRALAALGYKGLNADDVQKARDHGVSSEWVQQMRDAGYRDLSLAQLINARDHGVSGEFAQGLLSAGQTRLPLDELIQVRDHGVSPEYVTGMQKLGYPLPLPALMRARDHGVSLEYAQGMREAGYGSLPVEGLVTARDHGVSLEFVRGIAAEGYSNLSIEALMRIRDHGVTLEYVRALRGLGYDRVSLDDLVMLRDHGLTPDRIRSLNQRAGTRLPIDMLRSLASGGAR